MSSLPKTNRTAGAIPRVTVAGVPSASSDAAVARFLERFLEAERPGTSWQASPTKRAAA